MRYKFLVLDAYHPDTQNLREQGCEDPWLFFEDKGPIHIMCHISVLSLFHLRSVRMVSVHTVRRVQSPSRTARDRRPAIIAIKYAAHCHGMHFPLFVNY